MEGKREGILSLPSTCNGQILHLAQGGAAIDILFVRLCHNRSEVGTVVSQKQRIADIFPRGVVKRQIDASHFHY